MKYLKCVFCSVLAITYSNLVWSNRCDAVGDKVLDAMAKTLDVRVDEIAIDKTFYEQNFETDVLDLITIVVDMEEAIGVELRDEDVVDPVVSEEQFELKIKDKVTVREYQEIVHKACVNSLG
ncbi:phosphopantetheine-binding protein [Vibrio intestinalis]|uniref:phosphopantetheine-binding protein n=1 Tax=Vibrio intestinalis TaxID=2933291 RepID=UPI0021A43446|nr:acyl carrier protein [Vibrio intestinalis]